MEIKLLSTVKEYRLFYKRVYGNDPLFRDGKSQLLPLVCSGRSSFHRNSRQQMVAVTDRGITLCQCILICHNNAPHMLNIAFFEALPDQRAAVDMLLEYAETEGHKLKCSHLAAGMEGHLNYGFGFATAGNGVPVFGESYNPPYYTGYFENFTAVHMSGYRDDIGSVRRRVRRDFARNLIDTDRYHTEPAAINNHNLRRYTDLSNAIFADHTAYFKREYREDIELFRPMKPLLTEGNLIFLKDGAKDIGYVFWYPDFNELVSPGKALGLPEALRFRLTGGLKSMKMVEIGVLHGYRNKGLVMLGFKTALDIVEAKYRQAQTVVSSWIIDSNLQSVYFARRYIKEKCKGFVLYEKLIEKISIRE